jgi:hypothetical protein
MIENAELALARACEETGAEVVDFTVAPEFMDAGKQGRHDWLIEFSRSPGDVENFAFILDRELRRVNGDYDAKRYRDMALLLPKIRLAPPKLFYNWLKSKGKLGGQYKVPRLSNSREYIDPILAMMAADAGRS